MEFVGAAVCDQIRKVLAKKHGDRRLPAASPSDFPVPPSSAPVLAPLKAETTLTVRWPIGLENPAPRGVHVAFKHEE